MSVLISVEVIVWFYLLRINKCLVDDRHEVHLLYILLEHDPNSIIDGDAVLAVCIYLSLASPGHNLGRYLFTVHSFQMYF